MATNDVNGTGVQTDEKKQHFDDIYICDTPVPYKIRILDELSYVSDKFNREMFDAHIAPIFENENEKYKIIGKQLKYVDLCACFGNTTMAALHQMSYDEIRDNWSTESRCQTIDKPRRTFNNDDDVVAMHGRRWNPLCRRCRRRCWSCGWQRCLWRRINLHIEHLLKIQYLGRY